MKKRVMLAAAVAAAMLVAGCGTSVDLGGGWVTLIDGERGLENFNRVGEANWRAEGGTVMADKGGAGYLVTKKSYRDLQVRVEFWADTTTNSGLFMRAQDPVKIAAETSYEVNIYDLRPDPTYGTGAIVNFAKVVPMPKAGGKWNTFDITMRGSHLVVVFNGQKTVDMHDAKFTQGPFALQFAGGPNNAPGGPIRWRKLQVREL